MGIIRMVNEIAIILRVASARATIWGYQIETAKLLKKPLSVQIPPYIRRQLNLYGLVMLEPSATGTLPRPCVYCFEPTKYTVQSVRYWI